MAEPILLKPVGFFSDMAFGATWATYSLGEAAGGSSLGASEKEDLMRYLRSGRPLLQVMTHVTDPMDPEHPIISSGLIRTDGVWAWPESLEFFLSRYDVALPEEFVSHARTRGFSIPQGDSPEGYTLPGLAWEE